MLTRALCVLLSSPSVQVFTVEMHHKRVEKAGPGDNVGMNIKGLDKGNMPRTGACAAAAGTRVWTLLLQCERCWERVRSWE